LRWLQVQKGKGNVVGAMGRVDFRQGAYVYVEGRANFGEGRRARELVDNWANGSLYAIRTL